MTVSPANGGSRISYLIWFSFYSSLLHFSPLDMWSMCLYRTLYVVISKCFIVHRCNPKSSAHQSCLPHHRSLLLIVSAGISASIPDLNGDVGLWMTLHAAPLETAQFQWSLLRNALLDLSISQALGHLACILSILYSTREPQCWFFNQSTGAAIRKLPSTVHLPGAMIPFMQSHSWDVFISCSS